LRGTGHRQQQREFAKDIVLQFNSPPSRMDTNEAPFVALADCTGAERGCFGIAIVMVRDRSSSHSPHHATGGRDCGGLARRCKTPLWSVIRYLTQLPSRALSNSCSRCGQRHRAAGRDVMLCRTLLHSCHGRTARFNPSTTASRFDERLLKVMYFQPFSSGRVEYVKSGYRPLERVPGERTTPSSTRAYIGPCVRSYLPRASRRQRIRRRRPSIYYLSRD
jgi:hypothetical protein